MPDTLTVDPHHVTNLNRHPRRPRRCDRREFDVSADRVHPATRPAGSTRRRGVRRRPAPRTTTGPRTVPAAGPVPELLGFDTHLEPHVSSPAGTSTTGSARPPSPTLTATSAGSPGSSTPCRAHPTSRCAATVTPGPRRSRFPDWARPTSRSHIVAHAGRVNCGICFHPTDPFATVHPVNCDRACTRPSRAR